jgi:hypothetical protein
MNKEETKILLENEFEEVIEDNGHYYLRSKIDQICVLPYTISQDGLLDKIGIIENWNESEKKNIQTLLKGYLSEDDGTNLVGANRILYQISGTNISEASRWMFLGTVFNSLTSESTLRIYAVDVSGVEIKGEEYVMNESDRKRFRMMGSNQVAQSDDLLFLGAFMRLFNFFYTQSLK